MQLAIEQQHVMAMPVMRTMPEVSPANPTNILPTRITVALLPNPQQIPPTRAYGLAQAMAKIAAKNRRAIPTTKPVVAAPTLRKHAAPKESDLAYFGFTYGVEDMLFSQKTSSFYFISSLIATSVIINLCAIRSTQLVTLNPA